MASNATWSQTSVFIDHSSCNVCSGLGRQRIAESFCMDCRLYTCGECLYNHNKHEALKNHRILLENRMEHEMPYGSEMTAINSIACEEHEERITEMYCADHDTCTVCCPLCVAIDHRSCNGINYIPQTVTKIDISQEKKKILTSLKQNQKILHQLKASRQQHLASINNPMESKEIPGTKRRRSARLREAEKRSNAQVEGTIKEMEKDINVDICELDKMITSTEAKLKVIVEGNNPNDDFVHVKQGEQLVLKGKTLIGKLSNTALRNTITETNKQAESFDIPTTSGAAQLQESVPNKISLVGEYDIRINSDKIHCFVHDICVLDKDQLVIADSSNNKLKLLDNEFQVVESCSLQGQPGVMCKTGPTEVACILTTINGHTFVQFAAAGDTFTLTNSFFLETDHFRRAMCCLHGELFVLSKDRGINVCNKSGTVLRSFPCPELKDSTVMAKIWTDGSDLIVTDGLKKIYILDTHGERKAKITDRRFNGLYSIFASGSGEIFVSSYYANIVFVMDKNGKNKREILGKSDSIENIQAVAYLENSNCLVVGNYGTDKIQVFKL